MTYPDPIRQPGHSASRLAGLPNALVLLFLAAGISALLATAGSGSAFGSEGFASARQGGIGFPAGESGKPKLAPRFGSRVLREGMTGPDVKILRAMVSSKSLGGSRSIGLLDVFDRSTHRSVKRFQAREGLRKNGIVNKRTSKKLVGSMSRSGASWYGAPFFGSRTACGQKYTKKIVGVAHKTLPCGTRVLIGYRGRFLLTRVIDRGPYVPGRVWDLSNGARKSLRYQGIDRVRHLVVGR